MVISPLTTVPEPASLKTPPTEFVKLPVRVRAPEPKYVPSLVISPVKELAKPPSSKTPPEEMVKLPVTLVDDNPDSKVALETLEICRSAYRKSVVSSNGIV